MANLFHLALVAGLCASLAIAAPRDVSWNIDAAKPVNVTLYYESLCYYCDIFIQNELIPVWEKVQDDNLMTVNLLPFGNGRVGRFLFMIIVIIVMISGSDDENNNKWQ